MVVLSDLGVKFHIYLNLIDFAPYKKHKYSVASLGWSHQIFIPSGVSQLLSFKRFIFLFIKVILILWILLYIVLTEIVLFSIILRHPFVNLILFRNNLCCLVHFLDQIKQNLPLKIVVRSFKWLESYNIIIQHNLYDPLNGFLHFRFRNYQRHGINLLVLKRVMYIRKFQPGDPNFLDTACEVSKSSPSEVPISVLVQAEDLNGVITLHGVFDGHQLDATVPSAQNSID